jgi:virginiamycin A acetyltransferase
VKRFLKLAANAAATVAMAPCLLAYYALAAVVGRRRAFPGWSQAVSLFPGLTGDYLRRAFYRGTVARFGTDAVVSFGTVFSSSKVSVGDNVYIGILCSLGEVTLEDDVLVGSHVSITNGNRQHGTSRLDIPVREQPGEWPRVKIGTDTWIGERAIVMADVGKHCIIGAGAVVTKPIPDFAIAVGSPARIVGDRRDHLETRPDRSDKTRLLSLHAWAGEPEPSHTPG